MELTIAIIVIVIILVLPYGLLVKGYNENSKLTEENTQLKSRLEAIQLRKTEVVPEKKEVPSVPEIQPEEPLTAEMIALAIQDQHYGYVQEVTEDTIRFVVKDLTYAIYTDRLPQIVLTLRFRVDSAKHDINLLRRAAYQMSDEIIMVKTQIDDEPGEDGLYSLFFFLVAMDRNYSSFKSNLNNYITIIEDGRQRMGEHYDRLENERNGVLPSLSALSSSASKETKILS